MFKALMKKQMLESTAGLSRRFSNGKPGSKTSIVLMALLIGLLVISFGSTFYVSAVFICQPLKDMNLSWLFYSLMGLNALGISTLLSAFSAYFLIFKARDNELLLSLPIKPQLILISRLITVWFWALMYAAVVFIPALICGWLVSPPDFSSVFGSIWTLILISAAAVSLAAFLGWAVFKIAALFHNNSLFIVAASLAGMILYTVCYYQAQSVLQQVLIQAQTVSDSVCRFALPLYWIGDACCGSWLSIFLETILCLLLSVFTVWVLNRSFIQLISTVQTAGKKKYIEKTASYSSLQHSLLKREWIHFLKSPSYMLNCALAVILLPAMGIASFFFTDTLIQIKQLAEPGMLVLMVTAALCMLVSTNDLAAPSVSLEGKNLWILKTAPVDTWQILKTKILFQLLLSLPSAFICLFCLSIVLSLGLVETVVSAAVLAVFCIFVSLFGLALGIHYARLDWVTEEAVTKRGMAPFFAVFGSWGIVLAADLIYYLLRNLISPIAFLVLAGLTLSAASFLLLRWLKTAGVKEFINLS